MGKLVNLLSEEVTDIIFSLTGYTITNHSNYTTLEQGVHYNKYFDVTDFWLILHGNEYRQTREINVMK